MKYLKLCIQKYRCFESKLPDINVQYNSISDYTNIIP